MLTEKEKIKLANAISQNYYMCNFGTLSKSDLELIIFSTLIDHRINADESIDDYSLSKILGITQSRIRSLKERKELKYPRSDDPNWWLKELPSLVKNAKYDETDHYVKFIIEDISVMNEIRHHVESHGWYDECSLNAKLFRIPLNCFCEIFIKEEEFSSVLTDEAKKNIKKISRSESALTDFISDFTKDGFKTFLTKASSEMIKEVLKMLPFGGIAGNIIEHLIKIISE